MTGTAAGKDPANTKTHTEADVSAATTAATASAAAIATLCADAGVPTMAATLIKEGATVDQAKARVDGAKDIRAAVDQARKVCPTIEASLADTFISSGTSLAGARAQLFEKMTAAQSPEITSQHQAGTGTITAEQKDKAGADATRSNMQAKLASKAGFAKKGA